MRQSRYPFIVRLVVVCVLGWALLVPLPGAAVRAETPAEVPPADRHEAAQVFLPALVIPQLPQGTAVAAGGWHTCVLMDTGGVKCWGSNYYGQLGDGTWDEERLTPVEVVGLGSGVAAIAAGENHTCALMDTGGVQCWGNNNAGQLGDGIDSRQLTPVGVVGLRSGVAAIPMPPPWPWPSPCCFCWPMPMSAGAGRLQALSMVRSPAATAGAAFVAESRWCIAGTSIFTSPAFSNIRVSS